LNSLNIHEVLRRLPHRYPMLLIDRVLDYVKGERLVAIKNVTINESFFPGHFPHQPVMPGVIILEAMAQACAVLTSLSLEQLPDESSIYYFVGVDNARFKSPVEPGDQLRLEVSIRRRVKSIWMYEASAFVDERLAASAELMCAYREAAA
jgi:3-hydroxyacyl-[acyl-carrier-protein] dehydratase